MSKGCVTGITEYINLEISGNGMGTILVMHHNQDGASGHWRLPFPKYHHTGGFKE